VCLASVHRRQIAETNRLQAIGYISGRCAALLADDYAWLPTSVLPIRKNRCCVRKGQTIHASSASREIIFCGNPSDV